MAKVTYTYEDFLTSARGAGLLDAFSEADLRLAQENPGAGMSLLSFKQDYRDAKTDEARALANAGAERIRSAYGGYTAGPVGTGYYLNESEGENNNYVNPYADEQRDRIDAMSETFSYDAEADPAYQSYRQAYLREGQRAYENALGTAAANTGGVASTAAVTAAQQAQNYYGAQAADRRAALEQQAYENWLAGRAQAVSELGALDTLGRTAAAQAQQERENELLRQQQEAAAAQQAYEYETQAAQQRFENALAKWKAYGYVTPDIAETLSLPSGTAYSEQAYNTWYQRFQEGKEGVYTGATARDTANPTLAADEAVRQAAEDDAARHSQIGMGSVGSEVKTLQQYLLALGYSLGGYRPDGDYGANTRAAVRSFQSYHGLPADGICGPLTWAALIATLRNMA